jgi:hypothetical protein
LALFAPSFHLWNEKQAPLDNLLLTSEQNLLTIILVSLGNGHINGIGHTSDQLHAATAERPLAVDSFIKQLPSPPRRQTFNPSVQRLCAVRCHQYFRPGRHGHLATAVTLPEFTVSRPPSCKCKVAIYPVYIVRFFKEIFFILMNDNIIYELVFRPH